jgi:acyl-CoA thioesterase
MTRPAFEFDEDTALTEVAPGRFAGQVTARWNVGSVPNGGYLLSMALRAVGGVFPGRDPLSATAHYLRPAAPGPVEIQVEKIKEGRTIGTAEARLSQGGQEFARVLTSVGVLDPTLGPRFVDATPPPMPPLEEALARPGGAPNIEVARRFEQRFDPETVRWATGAGVAAGQEHAVIRAYQRFVDGRPPDVLSLPLFADSLPPPVFAVVAAGWVPTIELTVHLRAKPVDGWLRSQFQSRFVFGGLLEEDGEIWDASGQLVALSRQLAAVPNRTFTKPA